MSPMQEEERGEITDEIISNRTINDEKLNVNVSNNYDPSAVDNECIVNVNGTSTGSNDDNNDDNIINKNNDVGRELISNFDDDVLIPVTKEEEEIAVAVGSNHTTHGASTDDGDDDIIVTEKEEVGEELMNDCHDQNNYHESNSNKKQDDTMDLLNNYENSNHTQIVNQLQFPDKEEATKNEIHGPFLGTGSGAIVDHLDDNHHHDEGDENNNSVSNVVNEQVQQQSQEQHDENNNNSSNSNVTVATSISISEPAQTTKSDTVTLTLEEQIVILTKERDAAEQVSKELLDTLTNNNSNNDTTSIEEKSILAELQKSLQIQMTKRAEYEYQIKQMSKQLSNYEEKMKEYSNMEDQIELLQSNMTQIIASKTNLEQEVSSLRKWREEHEHNTAILSNRLNEAKKKEATKTTTAERLEANNLELKEEITSLQKQLNDMKKGKDKLESSMEKLKKKCIDRIQMTEAALVEERNLNEERKKKMKVFVEAKAEELRDAKSTNDEIRSDLNKTSEALNHVRTKLHHMTEMYESTSNRNRELIREIARVKKNTEQLHNLGSNLELELHKSAQETEEHKQKRNTAKHELMTMLRKLEAEQAVSEKLRDSIKFTFTPKALSQQQLLSESLEDFETELLKLSRKLGKQLPPKIGANSETDVQSLGSAGSNENNEDARMKKSKINSRSEWDSTRLLSTLEHETQLVSKEIMSFSSAVERLHVLLDDSGEKTCVSTLNDLFNAMSTGGTVGVSSSKASNNMNGSQFTTAVAYEEDDGDAFTGSPVKRVRAERYGLVGSND